MDERINNYMKTKFINYIIESIEGGISQHSTEGYATAKYSLGDKTFNIMFSYNPKKQGLHINWLGGEGSGTASFPEIMQKFATDVCSRFGPINPQNITFSTSSGPVGKQIDGSSVRERLFKKYINSIIQNMPSVCHPMRNIWKGSEEEFNNMFGTKK